MNVNVFSTMNYKNFIPLAGKKTNPIQTQSNPIAERVILMQRVYLQRIMNKNADKGYEKTNPISKMAKMNANIFITKDYENEPPLGPEKTNPIQTQSKPVLSAACPEYNRRVEWAKFQTLSPLTARPVRKKMLSSNGARDYNGIFSQMSFFQRTPNERDSKWKEKI